MTTLTPSATSLTDAAAASSADAETRTIRLTKKRDCKSSVLYEAPPGTITPVLTSAYVQRTAFDKMPESVEVTVRAVR